MEAHRSTVVTENDDSADDVFTSPSAPPVAAPDPRPSPLGTLSHENDNEEDLISSGSPFLPSHPEPLVPQEEPKVPPVPISINDENYQRGNWGTKVEYLAVMVCQLVTITIFSFSYFCYRNGGREFLLSSFVSLNFMFSLFCAPVSLYVVSRCGKWKEKVEDYCRRRHLAESGQFKQRLSV